LSETKKENKLLRARLHDFLDYFNPKGGVSDVPLGPFERAQEDLNSLKVGQCSDHPDGHMADAGCINCEKIK